MREREREMEGEREREEGGRGGERERERDRNIGYKSHTENRNSWGPCSNFIKRIRHETFALSLTMRTGTVGDQVARL